MHGGIEFLCDSAAGQFTFKRKREGVTTLSLIDVVGSSADSIVDPLYAPFSRRIETPPCADQGVFDHSLVELLWKPTPSRRPRPRPAQPTNDIRRPLPPWLTTDPTFKHLLARELDAWIPHRQQGGAGLSEFVDLVHTLGTDFLRGHLVEAVTTQHRLDVTAKVLYHFDARADLRVDMSALDRWSAVYPRLRGNDHRHRRHQCTGSLLHYSGFPGRSARSSEYPSS